MSKSGVYSVTVLGSLKRGICNGNTDTLGNERNDYGIMLENDYNLYYIAMRVSSTSVVL